MDGWWKELLFLGSEMRRFSLVVGFDAKVPNASGVWICSAFDARLLSLKYFNCIPLIFEKMSWWTWASVPVVVFTLWLYTSFMSSNFPTLQKKRIALVIAHPDDEAMFFAPTLIALTNPTLENTVSILCLSSGDSEGLGQTRKKELVASALQLGLKSKDDVTIIEDSYVN